MTEKTRKRRQNVAKASDLAEMLERQQYRCALTGRELTPETASIDHITPIKQGGAHELSNLWIVEYSANRAKHTMTYEEFLSLCRDVVRTADEKSKPEVN